MLEEIVMCVTTEFKYMHQSAQARVMWGPVAHYEGSSVCYSLKYRLHVCIFSHGILTRQQVMLPLCMLSFSFDAHILGCISCAPKNYKCAFVSILTICIIF